MIQSAKDIDWSKVDTYQMDHRLGILDHVIVSGIRYDTSHLNIRAEDISYYMGHQPLNGGYQTQDQFQPRTQVSDQIQHPQQLLPPPQQGGSGRSGFGSIDGVVQRSVAMLLVAIGGFVLFTIYLFKRLIVNKLGLAITDGFSGVQERWEKLFGGFGKEYFPDIAERNTTVFDQGSIIIAFVLLFLPMAYQIVRAPSKILVTAGAYIGSLVLIAFLYNLGVSNNFMEVMGSFPPLLSINPFSLFGYIGK